jgi:hypothetical protein
MIKLIRKNQKFVMVVLGIVLMVMFVANIGGQGGQGASSPVLRQVATLGSAKITQLQLNIAADEWQTLKSLEFVSPRCSVSSSPIRSRYPRNPAETRRFFSC